MWIAEAWIADPKGNFLERAVELTPANGLAWLKLGQQTSRRGVAPALAITQLTRAVALAPYSSEAHIALALELERAGALEEAERELSLATRVDRRQAPALALANFYVRRGDTTAFWYWLQRAAGVPKAKLDDVIELAWRAVDDPELILARAVPNTPEANRQYLGFLLGHQRLENAKSVWERMKDNLTAIDVPLAQEYVGRLIRSGAIPTAVSVWNRMCMVRLMVCQPLSPTRGPILTNGMFENEPSGIGFDWRVLPTEGVSWTLEEQPSGQMSLAIQFSGNHPEVATVLEQIVPVAPATTYQLTFSYRTASLPDETGIWIGISDTRNGALLTRSEVLPASERFKQVRVRLRSPIHLNAARLFIGYERVKATTREKGTLWLAGFEMMPTGVSG